jgi:hypothetical protein
MLNYYSVLLHDVNGILTPYPALVLFFLFVFVKRLAVPVNISIAPFRRSLRAFLALIASGKRLIAFLTFPLYHWSMCSMLSFNPIHVTQYTS